MSINVRISEELVHEAQVFGKVYHRSVPKQIEYWSRIGKIAEENPDLSYDQIRGILFALEEARAGHVSDFEFSS